MKTQEILSLMVEILRTIPPTRYTSTLAISDLMRDGAWIATNEQAIQESGFYWVIGPSYSAASLDEQYIASYAEAYAPHLPFKELYFDGQQFHPMQEITG